MQNRDRDKVSRGSGSTSAGSVNRSVSSRRGSKNESSVDFGRKIGQSESRRVEPASRRSGTSMGSSSGRSSGKSGNGRT